MSYYLSSLYYYRQRCVRDGLDFNSPTQGSYVYLDPTNMATILHLFTTLHFRSVNWLSEGRLRNVVKSLFIIKVNQKTDRQLEDEV